MTPIPSESGPTLAKLAKGVLGITVTLTMMFAGLAVVSMMFVSDDELDDGRTPTGDATILTYRTSIEAIEHDGVTRREVDDEPSFNGSMDSVNETLGLRDDELGRTSKVLHDDVLRLEWIIPSWKTVEQTSQEMATEIVEHAERWPEANWVEYSVTLLDGSQRLSMGTVRSPDLPRVRMLAQNFKGKLHKEIDPHFAAGLTTLKHSNTLLRRSMR